MNSRERFLRVMSFKKPDRVPLWDLEGFTPGTLYRWYNQGFPIGVSPYDYFRFDRELMLPLDFGPIPGFVPRVLEENDDYKVFTNRFGFVERQSKIYTLERSGYLAYHYLEHPTKTREDWESYKKRYNSDDIRRSLFTGEKNCLSTIRLWICQLNYSLCGDRDADRNADILWESRGSCKPSGRIQIWFTIS